jgi:hypothetical protein
VSGELAQEALVALIVAAALGWLVGRRLRRRRAGTPCENCPVARRVPGVRPAPSPQVLISISEPSKRDP